MFRHPKYYKELRKLRNKSDQAISPKKLSHSEERSPGPGPKRQAQAGDKPQAARREKQASSPEEQASSLKP